MMSSILTKTLYQKRFMIMWWTIGCIALGVFTMIFFPTLRDSDIGKVFETLPPALQKLAGDINSFSSIEGYIHQEVFALRAPMILIVLSIAIFVGLIAGEEQRGVLETQLSLPLSRVRVLRQKLWAALIICAIGMIAIAIGVLVGLLMINEHYDIWRLAQTALLCGLLAVDFGLVAFMIGAAWGRKGMALGIASGVTFVSYLVTSIAASVDELKDVEKLSLFHYYNTQDPTLSGILVLLGFGIVMIVAGFIGFARRDLQNR